MNQTAAETKPSTSVEGPVLQPPTYNHPCLRILEEQEAASEMNLSTSVEGPAPQPPTYNHPCLRLLEAGRRTDYHRVCVPLFKASFRGDCNAAKDIIACNPDVLGCSITRNKETPLHIAAMAESTNLVIHFVSRMSREQLELVNENGITALGLAVMAGNTKIAKILVSKNPNLLKIHGTSIETSPLYLGALYGNHGMVTYLYDKSERMANWSEDHLCAVFLKCVEVDLFDVALRILNNHEEVLFRDSVRNVLMVLARKPEIFKRFSSLPAWKFFIRRFFNHPDAIKKKKAITLLRSIWEKALDKPKNVVDDILQGSSTSQNLGQSSSHVLFAAAESGNAKFIVELIRQCPELILSLNETGQSIFHVAVSHRHEDVFSLLYDIGSIKDMIVRLIDKDGNNMLHLVSALPPGEPKELKGSVPALQMQYELFWLREVQKIVPFSYMKLKNTEGKTPWELFRCCHSELLREGEKWITETSSQSMVVAVLIATIGFSVSFAIPGGFDQTTGFPIFRHNQDFMYYILVNVVSFLLSSCSILMFLSILTSKLVEHDQFLEFSTNKLLIGQVALTISIYSTIVSFVQSFLVLYGTRFGLFLYVGQLLSVVFLTIMYLPLLVYMFRTFSHRFLFRLKRNSFFQIKPKLF